MAMKLKNYMNSGKVWPDVVKSGQMWQFGSLILKGRSCTRSRRTGDPPVRQGLVQEVECPGEQSKPAQLVMGAVLVPGLTQHPTQASW